MRPALLRAPEGEAHRALGRRKLRQALGDHEQGGDSGAVVVDAGAGLDRVEVGAEHDDVGAATGPLHDEVHARDIAHIEGLASHLIPGIGKPLGNVVDRCVEPGGRRSRGCLHSHRRSAGAPRGAHGCPRPRRRHAGLSQSAPATHSVTRSERRWRSAGVPAADSGRLRGPAGGRGRGRRRTTGEYQRGKEAWRSRAATRGEYSHRAAAIAPRRTRGSRCRRASGRHA